MSETKPTGLALLRAPFPANQISKLPKPTAKRDVMDTLPKSTCSICGNYHATSRVIHLDYVGHAALTDRLLDADPMWTWEPLSMAEGLPVLDGYGGMWIRLTVCGVTRLGYGHAGEKSGGDAIKEVIGDALRNAAMRFGAALDLWHKGDLHIEDEHKGETDLERDLRLSIEAQRVKRENYIGEVALDLIEFHRASNDSAAIKLWFAEDTFKDTDERARCWSLLKTESKLRSMLQANSPNRDHPEKPVGVMAADAPGLKKTFKRQETPA